MLKFLKQFCHSINKILYDVRFGNNAIAMKRKTYFGVKPITKFNDVSDPAIFVLRCIVVAFLMFESKK